ALVLRAHDEAIKAAKPGITGAALDAVARSIIKKGGYGKRFLHTLGHGIGKKVHEEPSIGPKSQAVLKEGMTFTVEPGIYDKRWGGIRIEDTVVMTKSGVKRLTKLPTSLTVIQSKNDMVL
ncbi:MAG: M24 family metallopeptidase, partial [bacterium]|nr:M24 family metallopeptidase [bacterium]